MVNAQKHRVARHRTHTAATAASPPTGRRAAIAATAVLAAGFPAPTAGATDHSVQTLPNGLWPPFAEASEHEHANGLEHWENLRITHGRRPSVDWWDRICGYQAFYQWQSPSGQKIQSVFSDYKAGCAWIAWFDFPEFDSLYVENTRFYTKFKSNKTHNQDWHPIGTLSD